MSLAPAFSGQPLDRADPLRSDPARLAELLADDARLLKLDGLVPELDGDGRLDWQPVNGIQAELVFLGIAQGRAHFAAVPGEGNAEPAYAQRTIWAMLGRLSADDLALYGTARSVLDWHARHRFCARCGRPTAHHGHITSDQMSTATFGLWVMTQPPYRSPTRHPELVSGSIVPRERRANRKMDAETSSA